MAHKQFVVSDLHFGHRFMSELRGFDSIQDMDDALLTNVNETVAPTDEVFFLGDYSFHKKEMTEKIFQACNGRWHLVSGNHDPNRVKKLGWETVNEMLSRKFNGHSYFMCHYPMLTWPNAHHGVRHLHGHSHGNLPNPTGTTRIDVGWDVQGFVNVNDLDGLFADLTYQTVDHH